MTRDLYHALQLPTITDQLTSIQQVEQQDLSSTISRAKLDFLNIPDRVRNDTASLVDGTSVLADVAATSNLSYM